ncbi:pyridoxal-phosphate dependent enzyme [Mobiluncus mulieris]|uniref:Pyridoxal-phosphate dependent enzyme n=1 Tax=Mobiluncus mulieris TaxID=2052 RepID=A0A7Y0YHV5_9ACTO|nr:pyridoxal-phosphate dependent enzyme [Mobiluncus mulieris]NMX03373.1 pyridoxal-phosphate dependent enzyme [Mobiluncus mulieris]NMX12018.1 pyridoxal-phosphate dependent enzyme [Mobiluncus mulieris]
MEIHEHLLDAVSMPKCIRVSDNLWALRFESMKLASCSVAVETLLQNGTINRRTTLVDSSSGIYAYALALTCHKHSLQCHIIASTTVDATLLLQLNALGASVEQVPPSTSLKYDQEFRVRRVHEYLANHENTYWMQQYHDRVHYEGYRRIGVLLEELIHAEFGLSSINLVSPIGSGASSAGMFQGLATNRTVVQLTGIQPFGSVSFGSEDIEDPDILVAGIGSAIPFNNIEYSIFTNIHWISAEVARQGSMQLLADTGIFGGLSSGAAYTVGNYIAANDSENLTLFLCPDMGYRYAPVLAETDASHKTQSNPLWISTLNQLTPQWCAMEWKGRGFNPASGVKSKDISVDG